MKNPFDRFLENQAFVVLDGAMATELETLGADLNDPLWSAKVLIDSPGLIQKVHSLYLEAGADVITTASYQATYAGFADRGLSREDSDRLFQESVQQAAVARSAFWGRAENRTGRVWPLMAASIGPYGAFLADGSEYHGNYGLSLVDLKEWHRSQVAVLAGQQEVELLLFETIPSLLEAEAIIHLMEDFPTIAYALSFSCKDGLHLSHGEQLLDAVLVASEVEQLAAIGVNCTAPKFIEPLLESIQSTSSKPLMVYPNSGEIWDAREHCWRLPKHLLNLSDQVAVWYEKGARIIGGCCRTTPAQIAAIRKHL